MVRAAAACAAQFRSAAAEAGIIPMAPVLVGARLTPFLCSITGHAECSKDARVSSSLAARSRRRQPCTPPPAKKKKCNQNNLGALASRSSVRQKIQCISVMLHKAASAARRTQHVNEVLCDSCCKNLKCKVCSAPCSKSYCWDQCLRTCRALCCCTPRPLCYTHNHEQRDHLKRKERWGRRDGSSNKAAPTQHTPD